MRLLAPSALPRALPEPAARAHAAGTRRPAPPRRPPWAHRCVGVPLRSAPSCSPHLPAARAARYCRCHARLPGAPGQGTGVCTAYVSVLEPYRRQGPLFGACVRGRTPRRSLRAGQEGGVGGASRRAGVLAMVQQGQGQGPGARLPAGARSTQPWRNPAPTPPACHPLARPRPRCAQFTPADRGSCALPNGTLAEKAIKLTHFGYYFK